MLRKPFTTSVVRAPLHPATEFIVRFERAKVSPPSGTFALVLRAEPEVFGAGTKVLRCFASAESVKDTLASGCVKASYFSKSKGKWAQTSPGAVLSGL
jgi:hypothetical protein